MVQKLFIFIFLLVSTFSIEVNAQVTVVEEPEISQMMQKFIYKHMNEEFIRGWRIQIITTDNRRKMEAARAKFQNMFPDVPLKWKHESPYYKVQVGAYENKLNLQGFLLDLKNDFSTAIPVMDDVRKSELVVN